MALPSGKKRYSITITETSFKAYKAMLKEFKAPKGSDSGLIEAYIDGLVIYAAPVIKAAKESGRQLTTVDFFRIASNMMSDMQNEQLKL